MNRNNINLKIWIPGILMIALLISTIGIAQAQTGYKQTGASLVKVAGTSTLHEWEMTSKEATYQANFKVSPEGAPVQLNSLTVSIPAESLKSGKGAMDKNAYNSLKTDQYKTITFALTTSKMEEGKIKCNGNLTISGVTKPIEIVATCKTQSDNSMKCNGSKALKMTDYKVDPPTFMFGSIKTGDEITVTFDVNLSPVKL